MSSTYWQDYVVLSLSAEDVKILEMRLSISGWRILPENEALRLREGLKARYKQRNLFPLARRDDSDDVVCAIEDKSTTTGYKIAEIHDYAEPGWELSHEWCTTAEWAKNI